MEKKITPELIQNFNNVVNNIISKIQKQNIAYSDWKSYYNLLTSSLCLQLPTIPYYDFANTLFSAKVTFTTPQEEKDFNSEITLLGESIVEAVALSKKRDKGINFELYNAISLSEAFISISKAIQESYYVEASWQANAEYMRYKNPPKEKPYINNDMYIIDTDPRKL